MHARPLALLLAVALPLAVPAAADEPVKLTPHKVVYDLSLGSTRGARGIETARGRIAFDFTGDACEGYALKFRQVTVLQSAESGEKTSDLRTANFESGDGRTFRFRNDTEAGKISSVDGDAERRPSGGLTVRLKSPKRETVSLDGAVFPNAHMRDLIVAARAGRTTHEVKVFDGSDDGRKVYDTLAVIGARIEPTVVAGLEEAARQDGLATLGRWPVTISYFAPGSGERVPVYVLGFELYDNGVSRALRLDYGDFALKGEMTRLELLPEKPCAR